MNSLKLIVWVGRLVSEQSERYEQNLHHIPILALYGIGYFINIEI